MVDLGIRNGSPTKLQGMPGNRRFGPLGDDEWKLGERLRLRDRDALDPPHVNLDRSQEEQRESEQTPQQWQDVPWTGILDLRAPAHGRMKRFLGWVRNADWLSHAAVVPSCPSRRNGSARLPLCTIGRERRVPHGCPPGTGCRAPTACHASASNLAYHLPESPTDGRSRGEIGIARAEHRPCGYRPCGSGHETMKGSTK